MGGEHSPGSPLADMTPARRLRDVEEGLPFPDERAAVLLQRVPGRAGAHRRWASGARTRCLARCCTSVQAALWPETPRSEL